MKYVKIENSFHKKKNPTSQHRELEKNISEFTRLLDRAKIKNIFTAPVSVALSLVNTAIEKANSLIKEALRGV